MAKNSLKNLDKFFIHQCMVRRFFKYNPEVFKKLKEFRSQLERIAEKIWYVLCREPMLFIM